MIDIFLKIFRELFSPLVVGLVVGFVLWFVGERAAHRRMKADAIRDLMAYRGDYSSPEFGRSLNKISVTFHNDDSIRLEVRKLYEVINNPSLNSEITKRSIVGLIYGLCQKNGFKGLTEYDIDQAFPEIPESKQTPQGILSEQKPEVVEVAPTGR
jgi:hypothetical protein